MSKTEIVLITSGTEVTMEPEEWMGYLMENLAQARVRYRSKKYAASLHTLIAARNELTDLIAALEAMQK